MVHTSVAFARAEGPAADLGVHGVGGPGLDEHGHGRRAGDHQPASRAAARLGHLRDPAVGAGAPGARGAVRRGRDRQRLVPSGISLLRPDLARRAAAVGAAPGDARAHRPCGDRGRHPGAAAGRAGRGTRLARRAVRRAHLARGPAAGREGAHRRGRGRRPRSPAADDRRWWRCALLGRRAGVAGPVRPRPGSRSARPRPARARSRTGIRRRWAPWGRRVRRPPTRWPARPTS